MSAGIATTPYAAIASSAFNIGSNESFDEDDGLSAICLSLSICRFSDKTKSSSIPLPLVWPYWHTFTVQIVKYLKTVLTEHNCASFTSAPVWNWSID